MSSEVLTVQDAVALLQDLVSFGAQVEFLSQIAHIEQFFVVFLEQTDLASRYMGAITG